LKREDATKLRSGQTSICPGQAVQPVALVEEERSALVASLRRCVENRPVPRKERAEAPVPHPTVERAHGWTLKQVQGDAGEARLI
jgi:hypothetical protein